MNQTSHPSLKRFSMKFEEYDPNGSCFLIDDVFENTTDNQVLLSVLKQYHHQFQTFDSEKKEVFRCYDDCKMCRIEQKLNIHIKRQVE